MKVNKSVVGVDWLYNTFIPIEINEKSFLKLEMYEVKCKSKINKFVIY